MKRLALLAVFVVAACGALTTAQAHTLSLGFKSGDTYKYKFHATSKQTIGMSTMTVPVQVDMSATETVKVNSVDSSGVADLTITMGDFTLKYVSSGVTTTTTGMPTTSVEIKLRPDGTPVNINGNEMMAGSPMTAFGGLGGGFFIAAVLPDHAVKAGDTWTKNYDQTDPKGPGTVHITSSSKYLRDETVNGISAAVVETKSNGTIDLTSPPGSAGAAPAVAIRGTFTTDVTTWIDPSGHRIVKSHSTSTDDATINLPQSMGPSKQPSPGTPMQGPITAKGEGTSNLDPA